MFSAHSADGSYFEVTGKAAELIKNNPIIDFFPISLTSF